MEHDTRKLDALSADIGPITAGRIVSSDGKFEYNSEKGYVIMNVEPSWRVRIRLAWRRLLARLRT